MDAPDKAFLLSFEERTFDDESYCDIRLYGTEGNVMYCPVVEQVGDDIIVTNDYGHGSLSAVGSRDLQEFAAITYGSDFGQFIYDNSKPDFNSIAGWIEI